MNIVDLAPFALTGFALAFIYLKRSKAKVIKFEPKEVTPVVTRDIFFEKDSATLRHDLIKKLENLDVLVHCEDYERVVFEDKKIGAFHWGFLYTIDFADKGEGTLASIGIFGKGPNPPRKKTQEGYLNEFINNKVKS